MKQKIIIYGLTAITAVFGIIMINYYSHEYMRSEFAGLGVLFWAAGWLIYFLIFGITAIIAKAVSKSTTGKTAFLYSLGIFMLSFILSIVASNIHMKNYDKEREAEYKAKTTADNNVREAFKTDSLNPVLLYKMAKLSGCYRGVCDNSIKYLKKAIKSDSTYLKAYKELFSNLNIDGQVEEANKLEAKIKELESAEDIDIFFDERDGHPYKIIKIGSQIWMAENLVFETDKGCWAYDNDPENKYEFGFLYDWETAQKVCPKGWHLPSKEEFETLLDNYGGTDGFNKENYNALIRGGKSGFYATMGGFFKKDMNKFYSIGNDAFFWSASKKDDKWAYILSIGGVPSSNSKYAGINTNVASWGFSIRCIKNN